MPPRGNNQNFRGRPSQSGRGNRSRGRGWVASRGRGYSAPSPAENQIDVVIQRWPDENIQYDNGIGRGRGSGYNSSRRSKGGTATPARDTQRPTWSSGFNTPRGRGRGEAGSSFSDYESPLSRGGARRRPGTSSKSKLPPTAPLSQLLYGERPLLKPVIFVKSALTPTLFNTEEEILMKGVEEIDDQEQSHVPTAKRVARVFSGVIKEEITPARKDSEEEEEELEEIDFNDMANLEAILEKAASAQAPSEQQFTGFYVDEAKTDTVMGTETSSQGTMAMHDIAPSFVTSTAGETYIVEDSIKTPDALESSNIASLDRVEEDIIKQQPLPSLASNNAETSMNVVQTPEEGPCANHTLTNALMERFESLTATPLAADHSLHGIGAETSRASDDVHVPSNQSSPGATQHVVSNFSTLSLLETVLQTPDLNDTDVVTSCGSTSQGSLETPSFYVDTLPSKSAHNDAIVFDQPNTADPLGLPDEDVIVYVAPHPRINKLGPASKEMPESDSQYLFKSILTGTQEYISPPNFDIQSGRSTPPLVASSSKARLPTANTIRLSLLPSLGASKKPQPSTSKYVSPSFVATPRRQKKARMKERKGHKKSRAHPKSSGFSSFGAMMSESILQGRDPRWEERRKGDSDIEWGDEDSEDPQDIDENGQHSREDGGMDIDPDLHMDLSMDAMARFANRMLGADGGKFTTMDDIEDEARMKAEDEDEDLNGTEDEDENSQFDDSDEFDAVVEAEEQEMIGESESEDDDNDEEDSEDENQSPRSKFMAKLGRLRSRAQGKEASKPIVYASDDEQTEQYDYVAETEVTHHRKPHNHLFEAVHNGSFEFDDLEDLDDLEELLFPTKRGKKSRSDIPPSLQAQWDKDRVKKAERKRLREQAKILAASDPLAPKKGGKKGRKASLAAARLDPTDPISAERAPDRVMSMLTLSQQIRRFLNDLSNGRREMVLPPMNKETRKNVHEMADAFGLKSVSKGKGNMRYTTLLKTTRSGLGIKERKIQKLVRRDGGWASPAAGASKGKSTTSSLRQRDGDEVGKEAPKIGQTNVGFRMLTLMGWSEGSRIGITGGLDAPLTAVIKTTKLGLGASH